MNRRIFIADDDARVLAAYKSVFEVEEDTLNFFAGTTEQQSFDVSYFSDGESLKLAFAQSLGQNDSVPLCILDMLMPGKSGLEIAEDLRNLDESVQILIMTAFSDVSAKDVRRRLNNRVFFQRKPFHAEELLSQVETLLQLWNHQDQARKLNETLSLEEERMRLVLEAGGQALWDWNIETGAIHLCPRWAEMLGYEMHMVESGFEFWENHIHPEDRESTLLELRLHLEGELPLFEKEYRMQRQDGTWAWILSRGKVLHRDGLGRPLRLCGSNVDLSQNRKQKDQLIQQEEVLDYQAVFLEELLQSLNDVIFEVDHEGRILRLWNQDQSLLLMPPDQIIGRRIPEVLPASKSELFMQSIEQALLSSKPVSIDYELDFNELTRSFESKIRPLKKHQRVLISVDEMTERKLQAEDLRQKNLMLENLNQSLAEKNQQISEASRAKAVFLATMSHEIRTPLNGVIGVSELLQETPLSGFQREMVQILKGSSEALLGIVNDVLDFSKIEAGKMTLEKVGVDLGLLLGEVRGILLARAQEKGLGLSIIGLEEQRFLGDPLRLRQILLNFVSNAIKFSDRGNVYLRAMRRGGVLRFEVQDSGIGIKNEQMENLFEPFVQGDSSMSRLYGGTGLGLSICKHLVGLMGGRIGAQSEEGRGSVFWFEIPYEEYQLEPHHELAELDFDQHFAERYPQKILVVDDHAVNRKVVGLMLSRLGYVADYAEDGDQALVIQGQQLYDVVFMDMQMPNLSGPETAQIWRNNEVRFGLKSAKIIALTANSAVEDKEECIRSGMDQFLSKPLRMQSLAEALAFCSIEQKSPIE